MKVIVSPEEFDKLWRLSVLDMSLDPDHLGMSPREMLAMATGRPLSDFPSVGTVEVVVDWTQGKVSP